MNPQIFIDMDGVLADFHSCSCRAHGIPYDRINDRWDFYKPHGLTDAEFWAPLSNADFWAGIELMPDGIELFARLVHAVGPDRLTVLSSGVVPGSTDGKRRWLREYYPALEKGAFFAAEKFRAAAPCKVLVDDSDSNVEKFILANGRGVVAPRCWNGRRGEMDAAGFFDAKALAAEILEIFRGL